MNRLVFLVFIFFFCRNAYSQADYCPDIIKSGSELTQVWTYTSKAIWADSKVNVKTFKIASKSRPKIFSLVFTFFSSQLDYNLYGLYIKFEDGTFYRRPDLKVDVYFNPDTPNWEYRAVVLVTEKDLDKFTTVMIDSFNFGFVGDVKLTNEQRIQLTQYIICKTMIK